MLISHVLISLLLVISCTLAVGTGTAGALECDTLQVACFSDVLDGMYDQLKDILVRISYINPENPGYWLNHIRHFFTRIQLRVGTVAGVNAEALRSAFAVVMAADAGHAAAGADLQLELVPTRCWCPHCSQSFLPADVIHACPLCGQLSSRILEGRELELDTAVLELLEFRVSHEASR